MNVIGLLRHGPTAWNRDKMIQGVLDIPLDRSAFDPVSWRQVLDDHGPWDRIVTSPLARARDTAALLFPGVPLESEAALREQDWGEWTGRSIKGLRRSFPGSVEAQERLGWDFTPPGGESRRDVLVRCLHAIDVLGADRDGQRILLVTHFGVIMALLNHLQGTTFLPENSAPIDKRALHLLGQDHSGLRILLTNARVP